MQLKNTLIRRKYSKFRSIISTKPARTSDKSQKAQPQHHINVIQTLQITKTPFTKTLLSVSPQGVTIVLNMVYRHFPIRTAFTEIISGKTYTFGYTSDTRTRRPIDTLSIDKVCVIQTLYFDKS